MGLHEELTTYGIEKLQARFVTKNCSKCVLYKNSACSKGIAFNANIHVQEKRQEGFIFDPKTNRDEYVTGLFHILLCEARQKK